MLVVCNNAVSRSDGRDDLVIISGDVYITCRTPSILSKAEVVSWGHVPTVLNTMCLDVKVEHFVWVAVPRHLTGRVTILQAAQRRHQKPNGVGVGENLLRADGTNTATATEA